MQCPQKFMSTTTLDTYFKSLPILYRERMNFIFVFLKSPWKEYADLQLWWIHLCILIKPISCEMRCPRKNIECNTNNQQPCISPNFYCKSDIYGNMYLEWCTPSAPSSWRPSSVPPPGPRPRPRPRHPRPGGRPRPRHGTRPPPCCRFPCSCGDSKAVNNPPL